MIRSLRGWRKHLRRQNLASRTVEAYLADVADFARWMRKQVGGFEPSAVSRDNIQRYLEQLRRGVGANKAPVKPSTVNRRIDSLRSFFRWARRRQLVDANPARAVQYFATEPTDLRWLSDRETRVLKDWLHEQATLRDRALIMLMLSTGLRVSEVAGIRAGDLDVDPKGHRGCVRVPQENRRMRTVPLNRQAVECLLDYFEQRTGTQKRVPRPPFLSRHNNPLAARSIRRAVKRCGERAGISGLTPHTLRHTFCRNLFLSGAGPEEIARLAGHQSTVQAKHYTQK